MLINLGQIDLVIVVLALTIYVLQDAAIRLTDIFKAYVINACACELRAWVLVV